jgi:hypothetical protein
MSVRRGVARFRAVAGAVMRRPVAGVSLALTPVPFAMSFAVAFDGQEMFVGVAFAGARGQREDRREAAWETRFHRRGSLPGKRVLSTLTARRQLGREVFGLPILG